MSNQTHTGFMRWICMGVIHSQDLSDYPEMKPSEQALLKDIFESIASWLKPHEQAQNFRKWDREGEFPQELIQQMKDLGLFGLIIPEEFGGLGLSTMAYARVLGELAGYDASVALTVGAHSSIGMKGLLLVGNPEQKKRYLPDLASGKRIAAFCLTEPQSGSDAASIHTTATKDKDGNYILNGQKIWITNGGLASFLTVFAKTDSPNGKMSAFMVTPDEMPGVSFGPHEDKMGIRGSNTTTVHFDNVKVPKSHLLGEEGLGFKVAMQILNSGRTGLGGGSVGSMHKLLKLATQQADERVQFDKKIAEFGLIKEKLGTMVVDCYVSESIVNYVSNLIDQHHPDYSVEAAISKVFITEALWRSADKALQIAGGNGYMREFPYERIMRDSRINRIFEGSNEILRLYIALTGMQDAGAQLRELSSSLEGIFRDPIKSFGLLTDFTAKKLHQYTGIGSKSMNLVDMHMALNDEVEIFENAVRQLSSSVDRILIRHGKNIINKQFATKRVAEMMIDIFALACTMSRVNTALKTAQPEALQQELLILKSFANRVKRSVRSQVVNMEDNSDEAIKDLADHAVAIKGYQWDIIKK